MSIVPVTWVKGTKYKMPCVVFYSQNGKYYNLKQVDSTGTSNGTDPTISTWYWEPYNYTAPAPSPAPAPAPAPAPSGSPTFVDNFTTLDLTKWTVSTWSAPGKNATHTGKFLASNVAIVDGMLCLKLQQVKNADGTFTSTGGEITSNATFGFGTYEFEVKASSTASSSSALGNAVSGTITGCFNYGPSSITEIDYEVEGNSRNNFWQFTSWKGETNPCETHKVGPATDGILPHQAFFNIKFVWTPSDITFFRNGIQVAKHTVVVPQTACPMMFNHWGTNDPNWGGYATPGVERFMWVRKFSFTPL